MVFQNGEIVTTDESSLFGDDVRSPALVSGLLEKDRKMRREIANSNERRRMQSINSGFQTLRSLLPTAAPAAPVSGSSSSSSEKLSKATILQQAAGHIKKLDEERRHLVERNDELQRALAGVKATAQQRPLEAPASTTAPAKRKKRDTECSDEGIVMSYSVVGQDEAAAASPQSADELRREVMELRAALDAERQRCRVLEQSCVLMQERLQALLAPPTVVPPTAITAAPPALGQYVAAGSCCLTEPLPQPQVDLRQTSMSRRNLQMIVEAIHHLEGGGSSSDKDSGASMLSEGSSSEDARSCDGRDNPSSRPVQHSQIPAAGPVQHLYYRPTFMAQVAGGSVEKLSTVPSFTGRR